MFSCLRSIHVWSLTFFIEHLCTSSIKWALNSESPGNVMVISSLRLVFFSETALPLQWTLWLGSRSKWCHKYSKAAKFPSERWGRPWYSRRTSQESEVSAPLSADLLFSSMPLASNVWNKAFKDLEILVSKVIIHKLLPRLFSQTGKQTG